MSIGSDSLALGGRLLPKKRLLVGCLWPFGFGASLVVICEVSSVLANTMMAKKGLLLVT